MQQQYLIKKIRGKVADTQIDIRYLPRSFAEGKNCWFHGIIQAGTLLKYSFVDESRYLQSPGSCRGFALQDAGGRVILYLWDNSTYNPQFTLFLRIGSHY